MPYTIRPMKWPDLSIAAAWAAAEGWNPGRHDSKAFFAADPSGFFIGEIDRQPVATFSAIAYDSLYGFVGFYIVHPDFRGRGHGLEIWKAGLAHLGARTIGLDGVVAQQENYKRSGFKLTYRNSRYAGKIPVPRAKPGDLSTEEVTAGLLDARLLAPSLIREFDRHYFPAGRDAFLAHWLQQPEAVALAHIEDGSLDGYGMVRPAYEGWRVGPLFAKSEATARALLLALAARTPAEAVFYMDVPEANAAAVRLAKQLEMTSMFDTARMYTGTAPKIDVRGIYGVTSLELG